MHHSCCMCRPRRWKRTSNDCTLGDTATHCNTLQHMEKDIKRSLVYPNSIRDPNLRIVVLLLWCSWKKGCLSNVSFAAVVTFARPPEQNTETKWWGMRHFLIVQGEKMMGVLILCTREKNWGELYFLCFSASLRRWVLKRKSKQGYIDEWNVREYGLLLIGKNAYYCLYRLLKQTRIRIIAIMR